MNSLSYDLLILIKEAAEKPQEPQEAQEEEELG